MKNLVTSPTLALMMTVLLASCPAEGFTILEHERSVSASAFAFDGDTLEEDSESSAFSAPDLDPFQAGAGATAQVISAMAGGSGTQDSEFLSAGLHAFGTVGVSAEAWDFPGEATAGGESHFEVTFSVATSTPYTLSGTISAYDSGGTSLSFTGPGGPLLDLSAFGEEQNVAGSGTLDPGIYTLIIHCSGSAYGDYSYMDYASGEYDVSLQIDTSTSVPMTQEPLPEEPSPVMSWGQLKATYDAE